jgi:hypothetical protein
MWWQGAGHCGLFPPPAQREANALLIGMVPTHEHQVAEKAPKGSTILAMLPDTGERYMSTALYANINEGTDPEP